jgi:hypothetical protein
VITREDVGAVILLCTTRSREDMACVFGAMKGVSRVERVRGPYDFVVHAAGPAQVEVIERLAGVVKADACWLSHRSQGGIGRHDRDK